MKKILLSVALLLCVTQVHALEYKIVAVKQDGVSLVTVVEYVINGKPVTVAVSHFQPQSKADVDLGIQNRFASEEQAQNAKDKIATTLLDEITAEIGKTVTIP